ncbi:MAG: NADH:ubiquinone reductase (Na(+)-transporting) subunit F [Gammaproteobacteria bacterium]
MSLELIFGILLFTILVLVLVSVILIARALLFPSEPVHVLINGDQSLTVDVGRKLLEILAQAGVLLPAACGGRGTCGQCKLIVDVGGGAVLPTETAMLTKSEVAEHKRLACQVIVNRDLEITVPPEMYGVKKWPCTVRSSRNVSTFIRELVFELPTNDTLPVQAGSYVMVECPPFHASFKDFEIEDEYRPEWDHHNLWRFEVQTAVPEARAYSLANYPLENDRVMLNVRIATPPPGSAADIPPGVVSSYLFSLKPGDPVTVSGPYGEFLARNTDKEMVFIGGGAGMAPMRSHLLDQLLRIKTQRKISFWYGARNLQELFYQDLFSSLESEHPNFHWHAALSDPRPEDNWVGLTGLIHKVVYDNYLRDHPCPEQCEFYICGPPMMNVAVLTMLDDLGVERESILLDDFES